jgi:probable tRNA-dihydrouridine synthase
MITIHGRTRKQYYSGIAKYDMIKKVKESVSIPVIANGDITSSEKALSVLKETGVDGIMISRGALRKAT